jgi:hypothetical protein
VLRQGQQWLLAPHRQKETETSGPAGLPKTIVQISCSFLFLLVFALIVWYTGGEEGIDGRIYTLCLFVEAIALPGQGAMASTFLVSSCSDNHHLPPKVLSPSSGLFQPVAFTGKKRDDLDAI